MSDEERPEVKSETIISTEYKDGQLQIVEVTPYDKHDGIQHILPDLDPDETCEQQPRYVQVLNADKSVMQLDLLNMTIVRCDEGSDSTTYKLIANADSSSNSEIQTDSTVTCVLQSSDTDDPDNQDSYVVMNGDDGPLVLMQSELPKATLAQTEKKTEPKKKLTPLEILERAKALQKAKALLVASQMSTQVGRPGRKRKSDLPPPHELLNSPNFKLFLYNCKMCSFKCNAIKEMTQHKAQEHAGGSRSRGFGRPPVPLQCARCPYKGTTHTQLMKHVQDVHKHSENKDNMVVLSTKRVVEAQVLVCGACGYESSSRQVFKKHIKDKHGASSC